MLDLGHTEDAGTKIEFSLSLVSELADPQRGRGDVRTSFSKDLNGDILLNVLSVDNTLHLFSIDAEASSIVRTNCIQDVTSYTHCTVQLSDTEPFDKIHLPLTLIRHSSGSMQALIGAISVPYKAKLQSEEDFVEIQFHCDEIPIQDSFPHRLLLTSGEKISDLVFAEISGRIRSLKALPLFLHGKPPVTFIAASVDNLPSETTAVILASFKVLELVGRSAASLLELLLSAFRVDKSFRRLCYETIGDCSVEGRTAAPLDMYFECTFLCDENAAVTIFDLVHLLLCDFILRDSTMVLPTAFALGLVSAWMYVAWDRAEKTVILDNFDYYNRISGLSLGHISNYTSVALGTSAVVRDSTMVRPAPCVVEWIERNISNMHNKQYRYPLPLTSLKISKLKSIYCVSEFFRVLRNRLSIRIIDERDAASIALAVSNAFNDFLVEYAERENIAKQSIDLALNIKWFPVSLRHLVEASLSLASISFDRDWISSLALMMGREDIIENASLDEDPGVFSPSIGGIGDTDHDDIDGFGEVERISGHRFPHDRRITEICRMLRSSRSLYLKTGGVGDADVHPATIKHRQQVKLLSLCRRSLAVVNGRGALTLGTLAPVVTEILPVPPLVLKGRCPPNYSEVD